MMKKMPPMEKAYEAYSAIADKRIELHEDYALVDSSDHSRYYEVSWNKDTYASSDNATYWQGYAGYPVIAVLILQCRLPKLNEEYLPEMADIPWKQLNEEHKRDYAAAAGEVLAHKPHAAEIKAAAEVLYEALSKLDLTLKRGHVKHPKNLLTH